MKKGKLSNVPTIFIGNGEQVSGADFNVSEEKMEKKSLDDYVFFASDTIQADRRARHT